MAVYKDQQLKIDEHITTSSQEAINSTFYKDFFGEDWSHNTSNKNSTDEKQAEKMEETNPMFRSTSGSFRYMRFKVASSGGTTWRSTSLSVMASKSKSRWQVFLSGFGSERAVPTKMDLIDIKTRQLHSQSSPKVCQDVKEVGREDSGCRRNIRRKKVWWRLVDVLGCGGGYERKTMVVF